MNGTGDNGTAEYNGRSEHHSTVPVLRQVLRVGNVTVILPPRDKDPMISLTVPACMFAAGVIGNALALLVLARSSRETKKRAFYRLVGALALTDLLGTLATSPVTLAVYANNLKWLGGMPLCNYESFMLIFAGCSTILIICAMAVDRFVSICHPFSYDKYVTTKRTNCGILGIWICAMVMGVLPILGLGENIIQFPGTWCFFTFTSSEIKNKIYTFIYTSLGLIGIGVTAISNLFVTAMLLKMKRRSRREPNVCYSCTRRQSKETQMLILLFGITTIFSTCWCPFLARMIVNQVNEFQVNVKADLLTLRLASLNQILDPWVYILFRHAFFHKVKFVFFRLLAKCFPKLTEELKPKMSSIKREISSDINGLSSENMKTVGNLSDADEISPPQSRRHSRKSLKRSRSSLMAAQLKLINGHTEDCPGFKHHKCLYCFTTVPQQFALMLGTNIPENGQPEVSQNVENGQPEVTEKIEMILKADGEAV